MKHTYRVILILLAASAAAVTGCNPGTTEVSSVRRGDQAFAQGKYEEALAEYRLAVRQGADDAATLARVAHTYAVLERVDDAASFYAEAVRADSSYTDEAVSDLMHMAEEARARNDRFAMASAVERALQLRPGLGVDDLALDLARHYFKNGQYGRALPFYQRALAQATDSEPQIVLEVGQAHEELGDCQHALVFFERYRKMVPRWKRQQVDWYIGTCSFEVARDIRSKRDVSPQEMETALEMLQQTLDLGVPRNIQAQAWFDKGEILSDLGDCSGAMDAYAKVRSADNPGALAGRAQSRFDAIRFGRGLESYRGGRCR
jgi:tetratricopeptide (TPR) repeat protein